MNSLKKLALATAIASAPFAANALEALDDEFLGEVTGQEGITIEADTMQTIEEFQYVDGDGDGSTGAGKIKLTNISIGNFSSDSAVAPRAYDVSGGLSTSLTITEIDAAANGVLITTTQVGQAGTDTGTTVADGLGGTVAVHTWGDGQDTYVGGIQLDNTGQSIGELSILNSTNYLSSGVIANAVATYGAGAANYSDLIANNANQFIEAETLISSKASGTGVHIETEGATNAEAIFYTDTDGGAGGNQVGVLGLVSFRLTDTNDLSADNSLATGTFVRGSKTEFDLDVTGGKLTLSNYKSQGNTVLNQIFIGDANTAMATGGGVIGGIAILGNTTEGTISISAH